MPFLLIGFVFGDIVCLLLGAYTYVRMIAAERKDVKRWSILENERREAEEEAKWNM